MKKKSSGDLMNDPFYSGIIYRIEKLVYDQDQAAHAASLSVKDSDAKSAIRKALGFLKGKPPKKAEVSLCDQWVMETARGLVALSAALRTEEQVEPAQFCKALLAVEDSLKLRREMHGHARGYLDFLKSFIKEQRI
ncbi:hypothetical protein P4E94_00450 [Pontiellaceae bacterium B12219]|nr:hypothetical protein [Pontiellaceae bacterium B12219]